MVAWKKVEIEEKNKPKIFIKSWNNKTTGIVKVHCTRGKWLNVIKMLRFVQIFHLFLADKDKIELKVNVVSVDSDCSENKQRFDCINIVLWLCMSSPIWSPCCRTVRWSVKSSPYGKQEETNFDLCYVYLIALRVCMFRFSLFFLLEEGLLNREEKVIGN